MRWSYNGAAFVLHGGEAVLQPLRCPAAIDVLVRQIDEVLLTKRPSNLAPDAIGLGNVTQMPACSQAIISSRGRQRLRVYRLA
jgi:hypothetical protein